MRWNGSLSMTEVDRQLAHLFKHPGLGLEDVGDVWSSDPLLCPAKPPAHWLMVGEIAGRVLVVPLTPVQVWRPQPMPSHRLLRRRRAPRTPLSGGPMTDMADMTPAEENAFYADGDNQVPKGPPVRRRPKLSEAVPVRFPEDLLQQVRRRAAVDDRSVANWIRRAVEHELARDRN
jgi:hypothetical protein